MSTLQGQDKYDLPAEVIEQGFTMSITWSQKVCNPCLLQSPSLSQLQSHNYYPHQRSHRHPRCTCACFNPRCNQYCRNFQRNRNHHPH